MRYLTETIEALAGRPRLRRALSSPLFLSLALGVVLAQLVVGLARPPAPPASLAVSVGAVVGVPAEEADRLKAAVDRNLEDAGFRNVRQSQHWSTIDLFVEVGEPRDGIRTVTLTWKVNGDLVRGTIIQKNSIVPVMRDVWREIEERAIPAAIAAIRRLQ